MGKIYTRFVWFGKSPNDIAIEAEEEELDENDIRPAILKSEVLKVIKDMRRKKAIRDDNIPVDLLKELGDSGLTSTG